MLKNIVGHIFNDSNHKPDILDCIANLSSDEVFTPPKMVDKVLDALEAASPDIFRDKNLKWLDPAAKTGIFLRQIATRLMIGLKDEFPDETKRREHIFKNMLYGMAITELTALMSRRSLYTAKNASSALSVAKFDDADGNIQYENRNHTFQNKKCIYCGLSEDEEKLAGRTDEKEKHAYQFIHLTKEEVENMKFDVIVGNPPYQLATGSGGAQATPIYQKFIEQAKKIQPKYIGFIIPSRWFAGGMGLNDFRNEMLNDKRIKILYDYPNASDCFPGVSIEGGVMYFIWDKDYSGDCKVCTVFGDEESPTMKRPLNEFDVFVRSNSAVRILAKVKNHNEEAVDKIISSINPFNFATNFKDFDQINNPEKIKIYANKLQGYIRRERAQTHKEWIDKYKVLLSEAYGGSSQIPWQVLGKPIVAEPPSVCTFTYIVAGIFNTKIEAENYAGYIRTRFFRFLVSLRKNTQHSSSKVYSFVPNLPMTEEWTDKKLYARYSITTAEQQFIESMIKEMK